MAHRPRFEADTHLFCFSLFRMPGRDRVRMRTWLEMEVRGLLFADAGPDPLPATSTAALGALGEMLGDAYARLIVEHKRRYR